METHGPISVSFGYTSQEQALLPNLPMLTELSNGASPTDPSKPFLSMYSTCFNVFSHFITVSTSIFPLATYSSTRHPPCEKVALFVPFKYLPLTLNLSSLVLDSPTMGKDCGHSPYLCPTLFYIFCRQCISMLYSSINL